LHDNTRAPDIRDDPGSLSRHAFFTSGVVTILYPIILAVAVERGGARRAQFQIIKPL
jgi:hypothetical protein